MVILLTGENSYQAAEEIRRLEAVAGVRAERIDGDMLDQAKLADIMKGASLFLETRVIVIDELSSKIELWNQAAEWLSFVDHATTLILHEPKPDKRTKAYKTFAKAAKLIETTAWAERQRGLAEKWLGIYAHEHKVQLTRDQLQDMVDRALVPGQKSGQRVVDQSLLARAVEALANAGEVTSDAIATVMPKSTSDAVFDLLDIAVQGNVAKVSQRLSELQLSQEGYQLFALVVSQWTQLVMIALARGQDTAGVHPYVQQKLRALAQHLTTVHIREFTHLAAQLDADLKSTSLEPWDALTRLLIGIAQRSSK